MNKWYVYQNGIMIEEVFFSAACTADYVRDRLIEQDFFPPEIKVALAGKISPVAELT